MKAAARHARRALLIQLLWASLAPMPAFSTSTIVPDQHATIQEAIDSGVDTVLVKPGDYPEMVTTTRGLVVMGVAPTLAQDESAYHYFERPRIDGFNAQVYEGAPRPSLQIIGLHIRSSVTLVLEYTGNLDLVSGCRIDGDLDWPRQGNAYVQSTLIFGTARFSCYRGDFGMNTVVGGALIVNGGQGATAIHDNVVLGPAPIGIIAMCDANVTRNYVRGCTIGINGGCDGLSSVDGNIVEDSADIGIWSHYAAQAIRDNVVRRSEGQGFLINYPVGVVARNVSEDSGAEGIRITSVARDILNNLVLRSGGAGLLVENVFGEVRQNRVFGAGGDGLAIGDVISASVSENIVGRSLASGIVAGGKNPASLRVRNNTSYLNAGAGFDLGFPSADSITHNIAFGNSIGLTWTGPGTPYLACNDWYANTGGAVSGVAVGATDLAVDPKFCDLPNDIVTLAAGSPLANIPGCGPIGALGVGCATAVGVGDPRPASLGTLRIQPQPSRGAMQFAWQADEGATTLEIFDVRGARRMSRALPPRTGSYNWNGADDAGQPLPAGVYFAKLVQSSARSEATVVVIR